MKNNEYIAIIAFVLGTLCLTFAYHNIDFSWNITNLRIEGVVDTSPLGVVQTMPEVYMSGLKLLTLSFLCFFLSFFNLLPIDKNK